MGPARPTPTPCPQRRYAAFLIAADDRLVDIPIGLASRLGFQTTWFPSEMLWESACHDLMHAT